MKNSNNGEDNKVDDTNSNNQENSETENKE